MNTNTLRKKAEKAYEKEGQQGVYNLADNHKELIEHWGYCKGCDCTSPAIENSECLVCGQEVELKYYQPEFDESGDIKGHSGSYIPSFVVWGKKENLLQQYPNCTPIEYSGDDIEGPTFAD